MGKNIVLLCLKTEPLKRKFGQLGNDLTKQKQVYELYDVIEIACGEGHNLALKKDGTIWAWGSDSYGQLGQGIEYNDENVYYLPVPKEVQGVNDVIAIACGYNHSLSLKKDGSYWSWGFNNSGQLGIGSSGEAFSIKDFYKSLPVQVKNLSYLR